MAPLLNLQKEHPNTLLNYHEELRGSNLGELDLERRISYDLRDFEREIFIAQATFTGNGLAVATFRLTPATITRPRSIRVIAVVITNEVTAGRTYITTAARRVGTFLFSERVGVSELNPNERGPIVGIEGLFFDPVNDALVRYGRKFVDVFANKPDGSPADDLEITSTAPITAADTVLCVALWETIPDPAKWANGAPGLVAVGP